MTKNQHILNIMRKEFRRIIRCYIKQHMATKKSGKIGKNYSCDICDYTCSCNSDFKKHLLTRKHHLATNSNGFVTQKSAYICDHCDKEYNDRSGLWRHKKKCYIVQEKELSNTNEIPTTDIDKEFLIKMLLKNQDVMDKMIELMPNMGMNHSNNTNTNSLNTNNFNIQMFLNDHCKNAMNLTDFIQSLPITNETYDNTIENGLTKTITNMMVNGLSQLDILERPIHCTDASRKTLYIKEKDIWEKDNELLHILKGIKDLSLKQRTMINKWKEVNTGWNTDDKLQSKMTSLVFNSMTQIESDEKETGKIIRSISKNVYLDNETKQLYI
jgi:hypothetical protein